ncbi:tRNA pseudouridine(38-40) synthase TruA [Tissierella sp. Yu-01]|uniref:tRNA pseudouridine(38-40) synthase TruA n=1 Tax=Tissierella sp. Yu-01 TaxID=3035694 RepID=UPI00240CF628|nr:tRNA pseudouridine(38-40) synthase TruA [Tissierella sp. Yu-01]WFA09353.1 tRNA pseudouridine(38-40) synthase TruA [Tissierella sp. Yu-01]
MRNIKILIEYDGSRYNGWQRLGDSDKTIQGKIENVITEMVGTPTEIIGSGRTDAGAHARGQVANFKIDSDLSLNEIHKYINNYLPQDIVIKQVEEAPERFHSRYNAKGKKYIYYVWNHWIPNAFERKYSLHYPESLDIVLMKEAIKNLVGTHDFIGFSSVKKSKKSTIRTIEDMSIKNDGNMLKIIFIGDGFLYNMVRIIMGTLLEIGTGQKNVSCIDEVFNSKIRENAGFTVPPNGLFLEEVYY